MIYNGLEYAESSLILLIFPVSKQVFISIVITRLKGIGCITKFSPTQMQTSPSHAAYYYKRGSVNRVITL
jgi:hypothetical protein